MKKVFMLLGLAVLFSACEKLDELTQFDLEYHTEAVIPATATLNVPIDIPLPPVTTNTEETFENYNTHKDLIEEITLNELQMTITDPADGTFSFLSDIEIYISTEDGENEILLAWLYNIPNTVGNEINLETTSQDLQLYLKADAYTLRLKVTVDELITQDYTLDIKTVFHVDAKILGI